MKTLALAAAISSLSLIAAAFHADAQTTLAEWSFTATQSGPLNTLTSNLGIETGTANQLGMTNSYTYAGGEGPGATANCDITKPGSQSIDAWRIRGNSNTSGAGTGQANGWNNSAPNYTQGAEFLASTAGYSNVSVSFLWYCTTQGVANMQVLYTTDGSIWNPIGSDYIATANNFYGTTGSNTPTPITVNLSGIAAAANDPTFGVEFVSVMPVSGDANFSVTNGAANEYAGASGTVYNNSSGNWSFDNITISATPVPEPGSCAFAGIGLLILAGGLLARRAAARA